MGLAGSILAEQDFINSIQPTSDDEIREADSFTTSTYLQILSCQRSNLPNSNATAGRRTVSLFEVRLSQTVESLQLALLEYFKITTKRPGMPPVVYHDNVSLLTFYLCLLKGSNTFQPFWLPNFQLEAAAKSRIRTSIPTLRGAFNYILDTADVLGERLQDCNELEFKLVNFEDLSMSELEMYEGSPIEDMSMDLQARRQAVLSTMQRLRGNLQSKTLSSTCKRCPTKS